ncbi:MAG: hypothetical protein DRP76_04500 [Candidatus Omnitrophota bacterium]|nr:MAG: hypothetical protein DRP76_04500 [Candidatus Omnitrophota bacterium]
MSHKTLSSFSGELMRIMPQIIKGLFTRQMDALRQGRITIPQFLSLDLIDTHGSLKMKEIAQELNITLPAATGLINRLFKMGLVKRVPSEKDRRVIYITLTLKGKKLIEGIRLTRKKAFEEMFGKLTEREKMMYLSILRKVADMVSGEKK